MSSLDWRLFTAMARPSIMIGSMICVPKTLVSSPAYAPIFSSYVTFFSHT